MKPIILRGLSARACRRASRVGFASWPLLHGTARRYPLAMRPRRPFLSLLASRPVRALLFGSLLCAPVVGSAQTPEPETIVNMWASADRDFGDGKWAQAAEGYRQLTVLVPANGRAWLQLGRADAELGHAQPAIAALRRAIDLGEIDRPNGLYEIARVEAKDGQSASALRSLEAAVAAGYRRRTRIARGEAFAGLRSNSAFQRIAEPGCPAGDRRAGWLCDLDYLVGEIRRVHPRYRERPLPEAFLAREAAFRRDIARISDSEAFLRLQAMMAALGDGHSLLFPAGMARGTLLVLPIHLYRFRDGLFVVGAADPTLIGTELLGLGGLDVTTALERLRPYVSQDNEANFLWVSPAYLKIRELLALVGARMSGDRIELRIRERGGMVRSVSLAATAPTSEADFDVSMPPPQNREAPLALRHTDVPFWLETMPRGLLYVQVNNMRDGGQETLAAFSDRIRSRAEQTGATRLILDLRRNNGGEATLTPPLLRTLAWFAAEHGPRSIVLLTGRNTFSAAQVFVTRLLALTDPILVGEPTGSRPYHVGDEAAVRLPYSGAQGTIASGEHRDSLRRDDRTWIAPMVPVDLESADYFAGRDPALDAAVSVLTAGR